MHIMRISCKGYTMSCIKIFFKYISRMMRMERDNVFLTELFNSINK